MQESMETLVNKEYRYGFVTDIDTDAIPKGLNEDIIRYFTQKRRAGVYALRHRQECLCHLEASEINAAFRNRKATNFDRLRSRVPTPNCSASFNVLSQVSKGAAPRSAMGSKPIRAVDTASV